MGAELIIIYLKCDKLLKPVALRNTSCNPTFALKFLAHGDPIILQLSFVDAHFALTRSFLQYRIIFNITSSRHPSSAYLHM